jgi:hypothetical protein
MICPFFLFKGDKFSSEMTKEAEKKAEKEENECGTTEWGCVSSAEKASFFVLGVSVVSD